MLERSFSRQYVAWAKPVSSVIPRHTEARDSWNHAVEVSALGGPVPRYTSRVTTSEHLPSRLPGLYQYAKPPDSHFH